MFAGCYKTSNIIEKTGAINLDNFSLVCSDFFVLQNFFGSIYFGLDSGFFCGETFDVNEWCIWRSWKFHDKRLSFFSFFYNESVKLFFWLVLHVELPFIYLISISISILILIAFCCYIGLAQKYLTHICIYDVWRVSSMFTFFPCKKNFVHIELVQIKKKYDLATMFLLINIITYDQISSSSFVFYHFHSHSIYYVIRLHTFLCLIIIYTSLIR